VSIDRRHRLRRSAAPDADHAAGELVQGRVEVDAVLAVDGDAQAEHGARRVRVRQRAGDPQRRPCSHTRPSAWTMHDDYDQTGLGRARGDGPSFRSSELSWAKGM
jgi:hypothetical protein